MSGARQTVLDKSVTVQWGGRVGAEFTELGHRTARLRPPDLVHRAGTPVREHDELLGQRQVLSSPATAIPPERRGLAPSAASRSPLAAT
ncbi:hypothetical protein [Streptomyces sp. NPDC048665]|uniref:hypothetical protein n=1 Tax=Streptomyces sp. NPDC048665 TaxID=3155490 RepID=UPI001D9C73FB|nr:hypothetical protein [Streptomyces sp. tea 10]